MQSLWPVHILCSSARTLEAVNAANVTFAAFLFAGCRGDQRSDVSSANQSMLRVAYMIAARKTKRRSEPKRSA